ncbi:nucleoside hydrolase [Eggerthellaceae bacterium zg-887]|nr:nucleoside hydrolase [Xiamenia xianingshaonis]
MRVAAGKRPLVVRLARSRQEGARSPQGRRRCGKGQTNAERKEGNAPVKRIVLDFDNTMGVPGCDVDDALALIYLLGNPQACTVEAVCTSYGNSDLATVDANTRRLFAEWGLDLPIHRGAEGPGQAESDAARFLAEACAAEPGCLSILVTGSTTNLLGAVAHDPRFFENVAEIVFMGGVTRSLVINGRIMNELNLSCDPAATLAALASSAPKTIATSQNCLAAHVTREAFETAFAPDSWLARAIDYWFDDMGRRYAWDGFAVWDQVAAAALIKPDLFDPETYPVVLDERFLSVGLLERAWDGAPQANIQAPRIKDAALYLQDALAGWKRGCERLGLA